MKPPAARGADNSFDAIASSNDGGSSDARRVKKFAIALLACVGVFSGLSSLPGSAALAQTSAGGSADVSTLSERLPALRNEVPAWIPIFWVNSGSSDATEFWITDVSSQDVELIFPAYVEDQDRPYLPVPGSYSSLLHDDVLAANEMDSTALRVTVTGSDPVLHLRVSYTTDGERLSTDLEVPVPIDDGTFDGDGMALATGEVGVIKSGGIVWLDVEMTALTGVANVRVEVASDVINIVYPNDALFAGLSNGTSLLEGERDFAAVRFDTTGLEPGRYSVMVTATYNVGSTEVTTMAERYVVVELAGHG